MAATLESWGNFYVIVGSSAGALTGLQFVVMTLIAQTERSRGRGESVSAFGTPNVVHFCSVLLVSAILSVPWDALRPVGLALAGCGVLGTIYSVVVIRRAHRQREYQPVFEDWLWHTMLPLLAYATMLVAGATLQWSPASAMLAIAAAALLLVFIGIHNAWDTVTYVTMMPTVSAPRPETVAGGALDSRAGGGAAVAARVEAPRPAGAEVAGSAAPGPTTAGDTAKAIVPPSPPGPRTAT